MSTKMVRKQIYIQKRQEILIKHMAQARGLSQSEFIRQAIESQLSGSTPPASHSLSAIDDFTHLALSKRSQGTQGEPYLWNRDEIYATRENRWLCDDSQGQE